MGGERNYARFYCLLKQLPGADKETLVEQYTNGRTTSLREMTVKEYNAMCMSLEDHTGRRVQVRKRRSLCLKLMQQSGVDTTDWQRINDFCRHPRIAGKAFARLNVADLDLLQTKLRSIMRKGGLKPNPSRDEHSNATSFVYIPMGNMAES
ncbi:hypothetical protein [Prevotella sp. OH937_COT-195]|uniref:hypothetical protein n=1 Tax=Prevotella sp. OH937_COT-195 TaxID=2491051 RepID=UPI000F64AE34|nr:hypothetical protein [Prevotella sp. OH937_COT-195]RRD01974.1 hypothetical protein EII32_05360 [Prevotella sp. OH937_COT-195]